MINRKIYLTPVVVLILVFSLAACRLSDTEEVESTITAADSLLDTNPYAALDTLLSLDSVTVAGIWTRR